MEGRDLQLELSRLNQHVRKRLRIKGKEKKKQARKEYS